MSADRQRARSIRAWHSEERAHLILENIAEHAVFMLDPEGRIESWNAGAQRLFGYPAPDILGKSFELLYRPEEVAVGRPLSDLGTAREVGRCEDDGWRRRADGGTLWTNVLLTAMRDRAGKLEGFAVIARDLTERRKMAEALRHSQEGFRLLVEQVQEYAIFRLDAAGRVASWNAGAERLKGYGADEIIGQHFSRFYGEDDLRSGKPERVLAEARRTGQCEDEGWRVRKDGSRFWADVVITALHGPGGELIGYGKVTRDLTARRQAEDERLRLARAEEAIRLRDEFLSIAAHELKTPLTALQMQMQVFQRRLDTLDAELAARFNRATRSAERLADLVNELLETSRLATDRFTLKRGACALKDVVREVIERLQEPAGRAGCRIECRAADAMNGSWDRLRIEQVVTNLLSNAIKFGAGAPVEVDLRGAEGDAILDIRDHGPGIAPELLPRLFGRFQRGAPVENFGGLGLGLYITRAIVHAHGGSVSVENASGGGARFTVRLPLPETCAP